ncbi:hypothetical protein J7E62_29670 [Variovorax paradoxus]|nr:hypothetical protein [Variovorax paradoxus]
MNYTPSTVYEAYQVAPEERPSADIGSLIRLTVVRQLRVFEKPSIDGDWLLLHVLNLTAPLVIPKLRPMKFGSETITALDYVKRVLEHGDLIDVIAHPAQNGVISIDLFWIHIVYVGDPSRAGAFSRKDDGLFAMRAKAGEKAERIVAKTLRDDHGHSFDDHVFITPGYFEIRYEGKKQRRPDLRCSCCGLTFEVKKRNRDEHFRVSHSSNRTFESENHRSGWHAFVLPDMKPRFLSNAAIAAAIANGNYRPGQDRYDTWADVDGPGVTAMQPPWCMGASGWSRI